MKKILSIMRKGIETFSMIQPGDRIAVGVSGGKDSVALLSALSRYRLFSPHPFELEAITLDMGFKGMDFSPIQKFCAQLDIPYTIQKTKIGPIVFETRHEKNPCAFCARMKRGALHNLALSRNCKKIAFGHHADDVIETFLMSLFYEGRINTFLPVTYLDRKDITLIRPFVYLKEMEILNSKAVQQLPIVANTCPIDGATKREEIKQLIQTLKHRMPDLDDKIMTAIQNKKQFRLWF
ncbi:MAG: tRNA 2-thiocytidine biosynthesis protein TtcA [Eubacteriaceae bacterium]|jgi:tRNA(Ile)-lysidine synthase TilS/MesJ|nr:tRNA 2-thiocytidine biosynthesis protein TtcA [Eubacteriaceae bacterium]